MNLVSWVCGGERDREPSRIFFFYFSVLCLWDRLYDKNSDQPWAKAFGKYLLGYYNIQKDTTLDAVLPWLFVV